MPILDNIKLLTDRCAQIERSQQFLSDKYDHVIDALQNVKKQSSKMENKIKNQAKTTSRLEETRYQNEGKPIANRSKRNGQKYYRRWQNTYQRVSNKLFGRINAFKHENNFKFLWTSNEKILLRESESSTITGVTYWENTCGSRKPSF